MNAFSRMYVSLAMQILLASVANMIWDAIMDSDGTLSIRNKGVYNHVATRCENWSIVVGICNGWDGTHTPENVWARHTSLLDVLDWFSKWEKMHSEAVANEMMETDWYIVFAGETWFCIRALILVHIAAIGIYRVQKREKNNPHSLNTDVVE